MGKLKAQTESKAVQVPRDAHVVSLLRSAGAIILGHANMSEWASVRSSKDSIGYSPRGGQVRNPYNLSSSPCKLSKYFERGILKYTGFPSLSAVKVLVAEVLLSHV